MDAARQAEISFKTADGDEIKVSAKLFVDIYADLDDWGKWTDREQEFCVDRKRGFVLGEELPEPEEPEEPEETEEENPGAWAEYEEAWDKYEEAYEEWEENPYELLYETGYDYETRAYRYWVPLDGLQEMFDDACKNEDQDEVERVAELAGKLYARVKDYGDGWNMCFLTVEITDNGAVLGENGLGGIESDLNAADMESILSDCLLFAEEEAGLSVPPEAVAELTEEVINW